MLDKDKKPDLKRVITISEEWYKNYIQKLQPYIFEYEYGDTQLTRQQRIDIANQIMTNFFRDLGFDEIEDCLLKIRHWEKKN